MLLPERCDSPGENFESESRRACNSNAAGTGRLDVRRNMPKAIHVLVDGFDVAEQLVGLGRGIQLALDPIEETIPELMFGMRKHLRNRWLRYIEQRRRVGHRTRRVDGVKHFDLT